MTYLEAVEAAQRWADADKKPVCVTISYRGSGEVDWEVFLFPVAALNPVPHGNIVLTVQPREVRDGA